MAALPKKKISKVRGKTRRAGSFIALRPTLTTCAKCGAVKLAHTVCHACGFYGQRKILTTASEKKVALFLRRKAKREKGPKEGQDDKKK